MASLNKTTLTDEQKRHMMNVRKGGGTGNNLPYTNTQAGGAPQYSDKYGANVDTSYYDKAVKQYQADQNANRAYQIGEAEKTRQSNLKQAYIQNMQNQRNLNNNLALAGIRGGATETSNLNLANQYGIARNSANTAYTTSVNDINRSIDQNIRDYRSDMDSRKEEYRQNMAQAQWQAAREDYQNAQNRKDAKESEQKAREAEETARQTEYWSNYYTNYYSGASKKDCKKAVKNFKDKLKNEKDPMKRIKYEQAIAAAQARLGVIANK